MLFFLLLAAYRPGHHHLRRLFPVRDADFSIRFDDDDCGDKKAVASKELVIKAPRHRLLSGHGYQKREMEEKGATIAQLDMMEMKTNMNQDSYND